MPRSLIIPLTLSLVLHGGLLSMAAPGANPAARAPALRAMLRPPPAPEPLPAPLPEPETLIKNTLEDERPAQPAPEPPPPPPPEKKQKTPGAKPTKREIEAVRRKLDEYVFYPEQARRMGIEGTVTLYVELAPDGRVEDVRIAESSGHPILDNAAVKGFYAIGRLPGESDYWEYVFRLE